MMRLSLAKIDRRIIYFLMLLALSIPLVSQYSVKPARMNSAEKLYTIVEKLERRPGGIAFVAMDFGPGTSAENMAQADVVIEHLMRRRIPLVVFSTVVIAEAFLRSIPEEVAARLNAESPDQQWEYGKDWVNLGFRPGGFLVVQAIPKAANLVQYFEHDAFGNDLANLPAFKDVKTFKDILLLAEFTGLVGAFPAYVQFFQTEGYRPIFGHGCTSITIPEAFIYMDSGQLGGLLEGIAGAAWYSELLTRAFPHRKPDESTVINTALGVAHLVIILLIVIGNITSLLFRR